MFRFKSGNSILTLSEQDGSIESLNWNGRNLLLPAPYAFQLRFVDSEGNYRMLSSIEFSRFELMKNTARWSGCQTYPSLIVKLEIRESPEEEGFRFRSGVSGIPEGLLLDFIEAPHISVAVSNELFQPICEGYLISKAYRTRGDERHLHFPDDFCSTGYYPGSMQMQFLASYDKLSRNGIYLMADDLTHSTKVLEYGIDAQDSLGLRFEFAMGGVPEEKGWTVLPFDYLIRPFEGDWRHSCELYRNWVKKDPAMQRKFPLPEWFESSPLIITYPVCGDGKIKQEFNRLYPYENALPHLLKIAEATDSRIMAHLMRWDHNGPWLPPYYWPPVGGAESFRKLRDGLHQNGHLLGVYGSGTVFTKKSLVNDYSGMEDYRNESIADCTTRGMKGESLARICNNLREGEAFCMTETKGRQIMAEQTAILADEKVDFFQLFDQNPGASCFVCYAKNHHHPPIPGNWQTKAMRDFIDELNDMIRDRGSSMILGAEFAAAHPYIAGLPLSDLRAGSIIARGEPVPAYQYVFHEYVNNFLGNGSTVWATIDCAKTPDFPLFRLAWGFSAGEFLTIAMRDSGEIDCGVAIDWNFPAPEQGPVLTLIRNLNQMRRKEPEFLFHGKMTVPRKKLECGSYQICVSNLHGGNKEVREEFREYPAVFHSAWISQDGKRREYFVNFHNRKESCKIDGKHFTLEPLSVLGL